MGANNEMNQEQLQDKINEAILSACEILRRDVSGENYINYALVILFVKYISDNYKDKKVNEVHNENEFVLDENCTFDYLYSKRNEDNIGEIINKALETITDLNKDKTLNLFADVDFNSEEIFGKKKKRNAILRNLLANFNNADIDLRLSKPESSDIIENACEYLLEKFASNSGKKGMEFYTPTEISILLAKLVKPKENDRVYDPACGFGLSLLKVTKEVKDKKVGIYGQESNSSIYNLCRINMFLHGVNDAHIECGDTLSNPMHLENDDLMKFDVIVSNPPFLLDKWAKGFEPTSSTNITDSKTKDTFKMEAVLDKYNRFKYGIPPKDKGDYAFIQHMLKSLNDYGRMAVVLLQGALFRGAVEGKIRREILANNLIDAVIGLPANLFYGTAVSVAVVVIKRNRTRKDILFIDASHEYKKGKTQNTLTDKNIQKISETYENYKEIPKYSHIATIDEIKTNEYNLNIKKYVDIFETKTEIDIEETKKNIKEINEEMYVLEKEIQELLKELQK